MTPQQWRAQGYRTIYRDGSAYLYQPESRYTYRIPVVDGRFEADDLDDCTYVLNSFGHYPPSTDFEDTAAVCYCDQGVDTCDYCAGMRDPHAARIQQEIERAKADPEHSHHEQALAYRDGNSGAPQSEWDWNAQHNDPAWP